MNYQLRVVPNVLLKTKFLCKRDFILENNLKVNISKMESDYLNTNNRGTYRHSDLRGNVLLQTEFLLPRDFILKNNFKVNISKMEKNNLNLQSLMPKNK